MPHVSGLFTRVCGLSTCVHGRSASGMSHRAGIDLRPQRLEVWQRACCRVTTMRPAPSATPLRRATPRTHASECELFGLRRASRPDHQAAPPCCVAGHFGACARGVIGCGTTSREGVSRGAI
eukprot:3134256-Rhodomonas_salina.2